jgi:hypothetical protein
MSHAGILIRIRGLRAVQGADAKRVERRDTVAGRYRLARADVIGPLVCSP